MFTRKLVRAWIAIILLSSMFLMGQEPWVPCTDYDEDGYGNPASESCPNPGWDCNDNNPDINPGMTEAPPFDPICLDGADNDCDGFMDIDDNGCWECTIPEDCDDLNPCTDDNCLDFACVNTNNTIL